MNTIFLTEKKVSSTFTGMVGTLVPDQQNIYKTKT